MSKKLISYTPEQLDMLRRSAEELLLALKRSNNPISLELLDGSLGEIIAQVLSDVVVEPYVEIPHFEKMARGYFPEVEKYYFNFYSWALFGKPAFD